MLSTNEIRTISASGPTTSEPSSEETSQPTSQPPAKTSRPTSEPEKQCHERKLCQILAKLGFCRSSSYTKELKQKLCPGVCK
ncbi:hypothetical protein KIN20_032704 [Parelaphostrongylus tenuis]|uniref:ShKT domain-containing protein n=1 Tax=Parelaphostrongylus tenuis TaxID=148309 RepID=A0AAD5WHV8_PARTN|nr:hypothetical protein KIN20_032704 [Parelaphostrongylus tenuis]